MPSVPKNSAEQFWKLCIQYLTERTDIAAVRELAAIENREAPESLETFYRRLLNSLSNRQGMPKSIGDVRRLRDVLCNFCPKDVLDMYGRNWKELFEEIKEKVRPTSRMKRSVPQNYWVVFSKGALDGAAFLAQFATAEDFKKQVDVFAQSIAFRPGLPQLLALEIHGFGFPLACDFLKESGWSQYAKPDVHTKAILKAVGFADGTDYDTFKAMQAIAAYVGETAYAVDKHIWLIGSRNLYNRGVTVNTSRDTFVAFLKKSANKSWELTGPSARPVVPL